MIALQMLDGLISKCPDTFIDQMQRLGMFLKIKTILDEYASKVVYLGIIQDYYYYAVCNTSVQTRCDLYIYILIRIAFCYISP